MSEIRLTGYCTQSALSNPLPFEAMQGCGDLKPLSNDERAHETTGSHSAGDEHEKRRMRVVHNKKQLHSPRIRYVGEGIRCELEASSEHAETSLLQILDNSTSALNGQVIDRNFYNIRDISTAVELRVVTTPGTRPNDTF